MNGGTKNLMIALVILAIVGAAGYFYATRDQSSSDLLVSAPSETASVEGDLLAALSQLQTIRFDTTVFDDPVFESLVDIGTTLVPQQAGRPNPFAPIGSNASTTITP